MTKATKARLDLTGSQMISEYLGCHRFSTSRNAAQTLSQLAAGQRGDASLRDGSAFQLKKQINSYHIYKPEQISQNLAKNAALTKMGAVQAHNEIVERNERVRNANARPLAVYPTLSLLP
jgi:hypothetical protein